jgi:hypothetical protein
MLHHLAGVTISNYHAGNGRFAEHLFLDHAVRELSYFGNILIIRNRLCLTSSGLEVM